MMSFEEIDHTADRAFRVTGRDMVALLENAARAMQALDSDGPRIDCRTISDASDRS